MRLRLAGGDLPGAARSELNLTLAERASGDAAAAASEAARLETLTPGAVQQAREQGGPAAEAREAELEDAASWLDALLALDRGDTDFAKTRGPGRDSRLAAGSQMRARIENLHAAIALRAGRFAEAADLARAGEEAGAAAGDPAEEAHAWRPRGAAHAGAGAWIVACPDYIAAVRIEERIGGGSRMAGDLRQLAMIAGHLGGRGGREALRAARRRDPVLRGRPEVTRRQDADPPMPPEPQLPPEGAAWIQLPDKPNHVLSGDCYFGRIAGNEIVVPTRRRPGATRSCSTRAAASCSWISAAPTGRASTTAGCSSRRS